MTSDLILGFLRVLKGIAMKSHLVLMVIIIVLAIDVNYGKHCPLVMHFSCPLMLIKLGIELIHCF